MNILNANKIWELFDEHRNNIIDSINQPDVNPIEPSDEDKRDPRLFKPMHWKWFLLQGTICSYCE